MKATGIPVDLTVMVKGGYEREVKDKEGAVKHIEKGLRAYLPEGGTDCVVAFGEGLEKATVPGAGTMMQVVGLVTFYQPWDRQFKITASTFRPVPAKAAAAK
jgi:hypothetical protein